MAIESLVALGLATAFMVGLAWYANSHCASRSAKMLADQTGVAVESRLKFSAMEAKNCD